MVFDILVALLEMMALGSPGVHEEGQEDDLETEQINLKWEIGLLSREYLGFKANSH